MDTANITTVVFDIGNVLLTWNPENMFSRIFGRNDFKKHPLKSLIGNEIWRQLDRGTITKEEACTWFGEEYPEEKSSIEHFINSLPYYITPKSEGIQCAEECKKRGSQILLLSNFPEYAYKEVRKKYRFFDMFDGEIISYQVKMIKPEPEIYKELLAQFKLIPEKTLFIDDRKENISGARDLGIIGLHMTEEMDIRNEVHRILEET